MEDSNGFNNIEDELNWVRYRIKILDIINIKLLEMRFIADIAKNTDIEATQRIKLNERINLLKSEINALDEESRLRIEEED